MQYPWAAVYLQHQIEERFPRLAGPRALRQHAQKLLRDAQQLRADAEWCDAVQGAAFRTLADQYEQYATKLQQRTTTECQSSKELIEHLNVQRRLLLAKVLAHSLLTAKREAIQGDPDEYLVLREALAELSDEDRRRQYRSYVLRTAEDFDIALPVRDALRVTRNARRTLERLLAFGGDDDAPDDPLTVGG